MEFNWVNVCGAGVVALMLVPNVVYALKNKGEKNLCENKLMNASEQAGRYACIVLMWFPLLVWEFGFASVSEMLFYSVGNSVMLAVYWFVFARFFKEKTKTRALILAVLPACIFLMSGLLLRHWLLVGFAVVFAVSHIYVTVKNADAA